MQEFIDRVGNTTASIVVCVLIASWVFLVTAASVSLFGVERRLDRIVAAIESLRSRSGNGEK